MSSINALGDLSELIWEEETKFRVHRRAYTDPAVFELEMDRIFGQTWIYVGHTSEIPEVGDYKTSYVGRQPVIVCRVDPDTVSVFYNRCMHRGAVVCREQRGSANYFRCPYHGWLYGHDGHLVGVPMRDGYGDDFEAPEGLVKLPRVSIYRGLIFASAAPTGSSLEDYLAGPWKDVIDQKLAMSPVGEIVLSSKPYVVTYEGNWKFQTENIQDAYHFFFVHEPFIKLQARYGDSTGDFGAHRGRSVREMRQIRAARAMPDEDLDARLSGEMGEYYQNLVEKYGREKVARMDGAGSAMLFPSLGIIHHQLRTVRPISVDRTEVAIYPYTVKGAPDAYNEGWLRSQERFYGPAGYGAPDDVEMFMLNQQGLSVSAVDWLILERGLKEERAAGRDNVGGKQARLQASEDRLRVMWRMWRELMTAPDSAPASSVESGS